MTYIPGYAGENDVEIINGILSLSQQIKKVKVYVKNPDQVPPGVKLQTDKRDGQYYLSDDIESFNLQKAYRINYQSKDGKINFIGANNEELKDKIRELNSFGHKILNIEDFK